MPNLEHYPKFSSYIDLNAFQEYLGGLTQSDATTMLNHFDEAEFFAPIILKDLCKLPKDARILEIGAGVGFLAHYFHTLGFNIHAIEPNQAGFDHLNELTSLSNAWKGEFIPKIADDVAETFRPIHKFSYIYALNVMEHVQSIDETIRNIKSLLERNGVFRFICPNYSFPYEPHFGIFAPWNKKLTFAIYKKRILSSPMNINNQLWEGINWISPKKILKCLERKEEAFFSRNAFNLYLERIQHSAHFKLRKGPLISLLAIFSKKFSIFIDLLPTRYLPIIDLELRKISNDS